MAEGCHERHAVRQITLMMMMTPQREFTKHQPVSHFACLYNHNKQMQSVVYVQKCRDRNVPRPNRPDRNGQTKKSCSASNRMF